MKTRIKEYVLGSGKNEYYPQYRYMFFWFNYNKMDSWDSYKPIMFNSFTECRKWLENQLSKKNGNTITKVNYYTKEY